MGLGSGLKTQFLFTGGFVVVAAIGLAGYEVDTAMNYVKVEAKVATVKVDCFVKKRKSELIEKSTGKLAYMDCLLAPVAAEMHGYAKSDIKRRVQLSFSFKSPVDGSVQTGTKTLESTLDEFNRGQNIKIYAHKSDPPANRWAAQ